MILGTLEARSFRRLTNNIASALNKLSFAIACSAIRLFPCATEVATCISMPDGLADCFRCNAFLGVALLLCYFIHASMKFVFDGECGAVSDTFDEASDVGSSNVIPHILLFNYRHNLLNANSSLATNVRRTIAHHPSYRVIFDDDHTCLAKISSLPFLSQRRLKDWWHGVEPPRTVTTLHWLRDWWHLGHQRRWDLSRVQKLGRVWPRPGDLRGAVKSDFCRLAQLYVHGGLYLDNDIYPLGPFTHLFHNWKHMSVVAQDNMSIYQALFAAPPRSPLVRRMLVYMNQWAVCGEHGCSSTEGTCADVGTRLSWDALLDAYGGLRPADPATRARLRAERRINLLVERRRDWMSSPKEAQRCGTPFYVSHDDRPGQAVACGKPPAWEASQYLSYYGSTPSK